MLSYTLIAAQINVAAKSGGAIKGETLTHRGAARLASKRRVTPRSLPSPMQGEMERATRARREQLGLQAETARTICSNPSVTDGCFHRPDGACFEIKQAIAVASFIVAGVQVKI